MYFQARFPNFRIVLMNKWFRFIGLFFMFGMTTSSGLGASNYLVLMGAGGNRFTPTNLVIQVGDTVTWTNVSGSHDVVCEVNSPGDPICGSSGGLMSPHTTFSFTYPQVGSFPYHCTPHQSAGMTGLVQVVKRLHIVKVGSSGLSFTPNQITIAQGDTVRWDWFGGPHNVVW